MAPTSTPLISSEAVSRPSRVACSRLVSRRITVKFCLARTSIVLPARVIVSAWTVMVSTSGRQVSETLPAPSPAAVWTVAATSEKRATLPGVRSACWSKRRIHTGSELVSVGIVTGRRLTHDGARAMFGAGLARAGAAVHRTIEKISERIPAPKAVIRSMVEEYEEAASAYAGVGSGGRSDGVSVVGRPLFAYQSHRSGRAFTTKSRRWIFLSYSALIMA